MPYLRTLFIGLGGAGVDTLECLKQKFVANSPSGHIPSVVKFLGIDSDNHNNKLRDSDILLDSSDTYIRYLFDLHRGDNPVVPEANIRALGMVRGAGCGYCRSNGRYLFKMNLSSISNSIKRLYDELSDIRLVGNNIIVTPTIDVHIITSSCGGTGSGILIELTKLIRQIIPNSRVYAYLYSERFFSNLANLAPIFRSRLRNNSSACFLEVNMEQNLFDFCIWVGSRIRDYVVTLYDAINRLSDILKFASTDPFFYDSFFELKSVGMISNWLSLGCNTFKFDEEIITRQLMEDSNSVLIEIHDLISLSSVMYDDEQMQSRVSSIDECRIYYPYGNNNLVTIIEDNISFKDRIRIISHACETNEGIVMICQKGVGQCETMINSHLHSSRLKDEFDGYCPFSDSHYEKLHKSQRM